LHVMPCMFTVIDFMVLPFVACCVVAVFPVCKLVDASARGVTQW
jgi:hypothetical protein